MANAKKNSQKFLDAFLPSFKRHLVYGRFYKCLPFDWNEKKGKIVVNDSLSNRVCIRIWTILSGACILFQIVNIVQKQQDLNDKLIAALILSIYIVCFGLRSEYKLDAAPVGIINRLISEQGK